MVQNYRTEGHSLFDTWLITIPEFLQTLTITLIRRATFPCPYFSSPDSSSPYYSSSTIRLHYYSSPLLFVFTTIRLHYSSSPLLFVSNNSSPLLFVSTTFRLQTIRLLTIRVQQFVSTTIRLHYYSSPLLFVSTTVRLH